MSKTDNNILYTEDNTLDEIGIWLFQTFTIFILITGTFSRHYVEINRVKLSLPLQLGIVPSHVPSSLQWRFPFPCIEYPLLHLNIQPAPKFCVRFKQSTGSTLP